MGRESKVTPDVTVSVVTFNNESCIPRLTVALNAQRGRSWEALFFDNASTDQTAARIEGSDSISVFLSDKNIGYSGGHNHNIRRAKGACVLILNADVTFPANLLAHLTAHLDSHPEQSFVGPRILEGAERRHFAPRRFYPGEGMIALEPGIRRRDIAWLNGCCLLARRAALEKLGGFDENFFLYQAETDLCLRARRAGFTLGWDPEVTVHHVHRQSQRDISEYEYSRRLFKGSETFWRKHYSREDVARMSRFQLRAANALLVLGKPFESMGILPPSLARERLRARRDICREILASPGTHTDSRRRGARIVPRQSRLAVEWVRQRQFPLDDY